MYRYSVYFFHFYNFLVPFRIQIEKSWDQDPDPHNNRCGSETLRAGIKIHGQRYSKRIWSRRRIRLRNFFGPEPAENWLGSVIQILPAHSFIYLGEILLVDDEMTIIDSSLHPDKDQDYLTHLPITNLTTKVVDPRDLYNFTGSSFIWTVSFETDHFTKRGRKITIFYGWKYINNLQGTGIH